MNDEVEWRTPGVQLPMGLDEYRQRRRDKLRASATAVADAETRFRGALEWLGNNYGSHVFYVERDVVFTIQTKLVQELEQAESALKVYNDHRMLPGPRRGLSADLAILGEDGQVLLAAEFKYEPCHTRHDVLLNKLPVTVWAEIGKDRTRVQDFVSAGVTAVAYAVLIDEGGMYANRDLSGYDEQRHWSAEPRHHRSVRAFIHREADPALPPRPVSD